jgi:PadR family transcriptional regulator PadR
VPNFPLNPVPGTLELLILRTLGADSEVHGFAILEWIKKSTEGELIVEDGALYHALHRMERRGLIGSEWGVSEKGRRARYYRITKAGGRVLAEEEDKWSRYVEAVAKISPCDAEG